MLNNVLGTLKYDITAAALSLVVTPLAGTTFNLPPGGTDASGVTTGGIPTYGKPVRTLILADRLDLSQAKYEIIQCTTRVAEAGGAFTHTVLAGGRGADHLGRAPEPAVDRAGRGDAVPAGPVVRIAVDAAGRDPAHDARGAGAGVGEGAGAGARNARAKRGGLTLATRPGPEFLRASHARIATGHVDVVPATHGLDPETARQPLRPVDPVRRTHTDDVAGPNP